MLAYRPAHPHDARVLELIISIIRARQGQQEDLTDEQLEALANRLIKGEVDRDQAVLLLTQQAVRGDVRAVSTTMEYLSALGMDTRTILRVAADFYLDQRHYTEAHRYAQSLTYHHDRYGPALRRLAILDVLEGDYVSALVHIDEYTAANGPDDELALFQLEALVRSGALMAAETLSRERGLHPSLDEFLHRRRTGHGFSRFSWYGSPTRSGEIFAGVDVFEMQRFLREALKQPLQREADEFAAVDRMINAGVYVPDGRQYGAPDVWILPSMFEMTMTGDCEDFALWAWVNLCRLGFPARFTIGGWYEDTPNHAWVTIHRGQSVQVLECTPKGFNPLIGAKNAIEYRPRWSVDRKLHCYRH